MADTMYDTLKKWRGIDLETWRNSILEKIPTVEAIFASATISDPMVRHENKEMLSRVKELASDSDYFTVNLDEPNYQLRLASKKAALRILAYNVFKFTKTIDESFNF